MDSFDNKKNAQNAFQNYLTQALEDGVLSDVEFKQIDLLKKDIDGGNEVLLNAISENAQNRIDQLIEHCISVMRFSPEDEKRIEQIAEDLRIGKIRLPPNYEEILSRLREFWRAEHDESYQFQTISVSLHLQKEEDCIFTFSDLEWHRYKTVREYGESFKEISVVDTGTLYITNKRLIFEGESKTNSINLTRVIKNHREKWHNSDALLVIQKASGPVEMFSGNSFAIERANIITHRLLSRCAVLDGVG